MARVAADEELARLRRRAAEDPDPPEAIHVNQAILRLAPDDIVAMNRLGRAYQTLRDLDRAEATFRQVLEKDPSNAIARRRLEELTRPTKPRRASPAPSSSIPLRDPEECLSVLDGSWRAGCVALLADALQFAQRSDPARTIVRDVAKENYFYVAGGAHAAVGPWKRQMDCYVDGRAVPQDVIDAVVSAGGKYRPHTRQGVVPFSIRLQIPFALVPELREALLPGLRDHIHEAIEQGPPQHPHLHNPLLARRILEEAGRA